jgi:hypothetical protein
MYLVEENLSSEESPNKKIKRRTRLNVSCSAIGKKYL